MKRPRRQAYLLMSLFFLFHACQDDVAPKLDSDQVREYAGSLYNEALFNQSIEQYQYYLDNYDLDDSEAANITFTIANIYFERLHDYENAMTYYLMLKHFYPESELIDDANKRRVECLERMQRSADAQQVLEESALLDPEQAKPKRPGTVIAIIGKRKITTGDLDFEINQLPPYVKTQLQEQEKKIDFLKSYIATELLYDTAKRKGLDRDKEVIESAYQAKKNIMVQKLLQEEISNEVNVREEDLDLYYKANSDKYVQTDDEGNVVGVQSLDDVRMQVMQDLIQEKQKQAYERLVERMIRAESVQIFEDKIE